MYLLQGRITYLPNTMFWGMPQQTESLYTLGMYLGGTEAATVLGWTIGVLTLAGLAELSRQMFGADSAWVATGSLISGYGTVALLGNGYVEWSGMLYGLATAASLITWLQKKETYTLVLAGIFAGMALGTKYTSGIVLIAGAFGIFVVTFHALPTKKIFFISGHLRIKRIFNHISLVGQKRSCNRQSFLSTCISCWRYGQHTSSLLQLRPENQ